MVEEHLQELRAALAARDEFRSMNQALESKRGELAERLESLKGKIEAAQRRRRKVLALHVTGRATEQDLEVASQDLEAARDELALAEELLAAVVQERAGASSQSIALEQRVKAAREQFWDSLYDARLAEYRIKTRAAKALLTEAYAAWRMAGGDLGSFQESSVVFDDAEVGAAMDKLARAYPGGAA